METDLKEKINKDLWYVIQRLKEESLRVKAGKVIEYWVNFDFIGGDGPIPKNEEKALEKIEELGGIKIISSGWEYE